MKISHKIGSAVALLVLLLVMAGASGLFAVQRLSTALDYVMGPAWNTADGAMEATILIEAEMIAVDDLVAGRVPPNGARMVEQDRQVSETLERVFSAGLVGAEMRTGMERDWRAFAATRDELLARKDAEARQRYEGAADRLLARLGEMEEAGDGTLEGKAAEIAALKRSAYTAIFFAMGVGLLVGIITFLVAARTIARPVAVAADRLHEISQGDGDLNVALEVKGNDEVAQLATGFNHFVQKIRDTIKRTSDSTVRLSSSAHELSAVTEETDRVMQQQQNETDQVATAMNEMAATVQEVARNAARAAEAASEAQRSGQDGRQVVEQAVKSIRGLATEVDRAAQAMQRLENDSQSIGAILDVIRGIAEQTNLLALNAAIEAARAGEQGRGFAVVADEVRVLARRTQQSTQEIQNMIERLQGGAREAATVMEQGRKQADVSVRQAGEAGDALRKIADAISVINDMNTHIASAAEEQASVAEEMNRNLSNISHLSEQTSAGSRQTAAASDELARLAAELQGLMGQFRT
jgi:methyl-accepting chemotaxis protein